MIKNYPPDSDPKAQEEYRITDPGMFIVGDDVIWDGEAESTGTEPKTKVDMPPHEAE